MQDQVIRQLEKIRNLPTLPEVITRLRRAVSNPASDAARVARIIEDDPSMMARVLKLVNSVFYAGLEPVTSVQHAVARIGFNAVSNVAMSTSVFTAFQAMGAGDFDREAFWKHSISSASAVLLLHDRAGAVLAHRYPKDVLHLAGLIHDIGKIVFELAFREAFAAARRAAADRRMPLIEAEPEFLSADHAEVGAWLGRKWNLIPEVVSAIRWHHAPDQAPEEHADLTRLCHAANHLCNMEKLGDGGDCTAPALQAGTWTWLNIKTDDLPGLAERIKAEAVKSEILLSFS